jgi:hypothetical protein
MGLERKPGQMGLEPALEGTHLEGGPPRHINPGRCPPLAARIQEKVTPKEDHVDTIHQIAEPESHERQSAVLIT